MTRSSERGRSPAAKARRMDKYRAIQRSQAKATPLVVDAVERRIVVLPDGRTGRLLSVPGQSSHRSSGAKARVQLSSGAVLSFAMSDLRVLA